ncbi:integrase catalytic domain-containing protein [Trichonephila clavipes]|nr:integrase catalytic domain-containing protein [Trichonephila clavipes]
MMSDLPSSRISPAPAFMRCGVDYASPFQIKTIKGGGSKSFKAYIALFACFTTRAIHLELVTDLSADAFIAALKRPLTPISNDLNNLSALTPGHFIIGRPLTSIPEPNYIDSNNSYLTRWQQIQKLVQQFWKRWHKEYLTRLQQRLKWLLPTKNFQVNDLCLIKDDNLPPTRWKIGRIVQSYPGLDNEARVVNVKTSDGIFKRNITKLSLLPI